MALLAALGLIVLALLVLVGWREGPGDGPDDDDDSNGPDGGRRIPIRIPTQDRGPR
jgi:hypothetical protein